MLALSTVAREPPQLLTSMNLTVLIYKNEAFGPEYEGPFQLKILCLMNHWLEGTLRNHLVILLASRRTLSKLFWEENVRSSICFFILLSVVVALCRRVLTQNGNGPWRVSERILG